MASFTTEIKESFRKGNITTKLIYLNIAVFLVVRLTEVIFYLSGSSFSLINYLALPADASKLLMLPWTLVTYMFLHHDFLHIIFNLLWLFWMGELFLRYFSSKQMLAIYLLGGISGGVLYILAYNLVPTLQAHLSNVQLLGASASVLAIVASVATFAPNHPIRLMFVGQVKMKHLAIFSVLIYAIGISSQNTGGNIAHLGGMLCGFLFVHYLRKGVDVTKPVSSLTAWVERLFTPKQKIRMTYKNAANYSSNTRNKSKQEVINAILEKVSKSGYDSLSSEEKEILFKMDRD